MRLTSYLERTIDGWVRFPADALARCEDFPAYARHLTADLAATACWLLAVLLVVFWPTDIVVFREDALFRFAFVWRATSLVACWIGMRAAARARLDADRWPVRSMVAVELLLLASTSVLLGKIGNVVSGAPWLAYLTVIVPLGAQIFLLPLAERIAHTLAASTVSASAYLATSGVVGMDPYLGASVVMLVAVNALAIVIGHAFYRLTEAHWARTRELVRLATTDPLTGVMNRQHFLERADEELLRARRYGRPLAAIMIDLDHFKDANDRHGHAAGDAVLRAVAAALGGELRDVDLLGRLGGEELAVLLPETGVDAAFAVAERLRDAVRGAYGSAPWDRVSVTASLGVTELAPGDADVAAVLGRADRALYRAKEAGRDRVERAPAPQA